MSPSLVDRIRQLMHEQADSMGNLLVEAFHYVALFIIGGAVIWASGVTFMGMVQNGVVTIDDVLLLFIYLELGAMVGIYFKTNQMPVRFLIYVAITALTRLLIADIQHEHKPTIGIVITCGGILILTLATLVVRYGASRYPSPLSERTVERRHVAESPTE